MMAQRLWVVTERTYTEGNVRGVFSLKALALQYIKDVARGAFPSRADDLELSEITVNEPDGSLTVTKEAHLRCYSVAKGSAESVIGPWARAREEEAERRRVAHENSEALKAALRAMGPNPPPVLRGSP